MKSRKFSAAAASPVSAVASGIGRLRPGARLEQVGEEHPERQRDERGDDEPAHRLRRRCRPPPWRCRSCAMPETIVAKTSGAMIILISRRKMSVTMVKPEASCFAWSGSTAKRLHHDADRDPEDQADADQCGQPAARSWWRRRGSCRFLLRFVVEIVAQASGCGRVSRSGRSTASSFSRVISPFSSTSSSTPRPEWCASSATSVALA